MAQQENFNPADILGLDKVTENKTNFQQTTNFVENKRSSFKRSVQEDEAEQQGTLEYSSGVVRTESAPTYNLPETNKALYGTNLGITKYESLRKAVGLADGQSFTEFYNTNKFIPEGFELEAKLLLREEKVKELEQEYKEGKRGYSDFLYEAYGKDIMKKDGHDLSSSLYWYTRRKNGQMDSILDNTTYMEGIISTAESYYMAEEWNRTSNTALYEDSLDSLITGETLNSKTMRELFPDQFNALDDVIDSDQKIMDLYLAGLLQGFNPTIDENKDGKIDYYLHTNGILYKVSDGDKAGSREAKATYNKDGSLREILLPGQLPDGGISDAFISSFSKVFTGIIDIVPLVVTGIVDLGEGIFTGDWEADKMANYTIWSNKWQNAWNITNTDVYTTSQGFNTSDGETDWTNIARGVSSAAGTIVGMLALAGVGGALSKVGSGGSALAGEAAKATIGSTAKTIGIKSLNLVGKAMTSLSGFQNGAPIFGAKTLNSATIQSVSLLFVKDLTSSISQMAATKDQTGLTDDQIAGNAFLMSSVNAGISYMLRSTMDTGAIQRHATTAAQKAVRAGTLAEDFMTATGSDGRWFVNVLRGEGNPFLKALSHPISNTLLDTAENFLTMSNQMALTRMNSETTLGKALGESYLQNLTNPQTIAMNMFAAYTTYKGGLGKTNTGLETGAILDTLGNLKVLVDGGVNKDPKNLDGVGVRTQIKIMMKKETDPAKLRQLTNILAKFDTDLIRRKDEKGNIVNHTDPAAGIVYALRQLHEGLKTDTGDSIVTNTLKSLYKKNYITERLIESDAVINYYNNFIKAKNKTNTDILKSGAYKEIFSKKAVKIIERALGDRQDILATNIKSIMYDQKITQESQAAALGKIDADLPSIIKTLFDKHILTIDMLPDIKIDTTTMDDLNAKGSTDKKRYAADLKSKLSPQELATLEKFGFEGEAIGNGFKINITGIGSDEQVATEQFRGILKAITSLLGDDAKSLIINLNPGVDDSYFIPFTSQFGTVKFTDFLGSAIRASLGIKHASTPELRFKSLELLYSVFNDGNVDTALKEHLNSTDAAIKGKALEDIHKYIDALVANKVISLPEAARLLSSSTERPESTASTSHEKYYKFITLWDTVAKELHGIEAKDYTDKQKKMAADIIKAFDSLPQDVRDALNKKSVSSGFADFSADDYRALRLGVRVNNPQDVSGELDYQRKIVHVNDPFGGSPEIEQLVRQQIAQELSNKPDNSDNNRSKYTIDDLINSVNKKKPKSKNGKLQLETDQRILSMLKNEGVDVTDLHLLNEEGIRNLFQNKKGLSKEDSDRAIKLISDYKKSAINKAYKDETLRNEFYQRVFQRLISDGLNINIPASTDALDFNKFIMETALRYSKDILLHINSIDTNAQDFVNRATNVARELYFKDTASAERSDVVVIDLRNFHGKNHQYLIDRIGEKVSTIGASFLNPNKSLTEQLAQIFGNESNEMVLKLSREINNLNEIRAEHMDTDVLTFDTSTPDGRASLAEFLDKFNYRFDSIANEPFLDARGIYYLHSNIGVTEQSVLLNLKAGSSYGDLMADLTERMKKREVEIVSSATKEDYVLALNELIGDMFFVDEDARLGSLKNIPLTSLAAGELNDQELAKRIQTLWSSKTIDAGGKQGKLGGLVADTLTLLKKSKGFVGKQDQDLATTKLIFETASVLENMLAMSTTKNADFSILRVNLTEEELKELTSLGIWKVNGSKIGDAGNGVSTYSISLNTDGDFFNKIVSYMKDNNGINFKQIIPLYENLNALPNKAMDAMRPDGGVAEPSTNTFGYTPFQFLVGQGGVSISQGEMDYLYSNKLFISDSYDLTIDSYKKAQEALKNLTIKDILNIENTSTETITPTLEKDLKVNDIVKYTVFDSVSNKLITLNAEIINIVKVGNTIEVTHRLPTGDERMKVYNVGGTKGLTVDVVTINKSAKSKFTPNEVEELKRNPFAKMIITSTIASYKLNKFIFEQLESFGLNKKLLMALSSEEGRIIIGHMLNSGESSSKISSELNKVLSNGIQSKARTSDPAYSNIKADGNTTLNTNTLSRLEVSSKTAIEISPEDIDKLRQYFDMNQFVHVVKRQTEGNDFSELFAILKASERSNTTSTLNILVPFLLSMSDNSREIMFNFLGKYISEQDLSILKKKFELIDDNSFRLGKREEVPTTERLATPGVVNETRNQAIADNENFASNKQIKHLIQMGLAYETRSKQLKLRQKVSSLKDEGGTNWVYNMASKQEQTLQEFNSINNKGSRLIDNIEISSRLGQIVLARTQTAQAIKEMGFTKDINTAVKLSKVLYDLSAGVDYSSEWTKYVIIDEDGEVVSSAQNMHGARTFNDLFISLNNLFGQDGGLEKRFTIIELNKNMMNGSAGLSNEKFSYFNVDDTNRDIFISLLRHNALQQLDANDLVRLGKDSTEDDKISYVYKRSLTNKFYEEKLIHIVKTAFNSIPQSEQIARGLIRTMDDLNSARKSMNLTEEGFARDLMLAASPYSDAADLVNLEMLKLNDIVRYAINEDSIPANIKLLLSESLSNFLSDQSDKAKSNTVEIQKLKELIKSKRLTTETLQRDIAEIHKSRSDLHIQADKDYATVKELNKGIKSSWEEYYKFLNELVSKDFKNESPEIIEAFNKIILLKEDQNLSLLKNNLDKIIEKISSSILTEQKKNKKTNLNSLLKKFDLLKDGADTKDILSKSYELFYKTGYLANKEYQSNGSTDLSKKLYQDRFELSYIINTLRKLNKDFYDASKAYNDANRSIRSKINAELQKIVSGTEQGRIDKLKERASQYVELQQKNNELSAAYNQNLSEVYSRIEKVYGVINSQNAVNKSIDKFLDAFKRGNENDLKIASTLIKDFINDGIIESEEEAYIQIVSRMLLSSDKGNVLSMRIAGQTLTELFDMHSEKPLYEFKLVDSNGIVTKVNHTDLLSRGSYQIDSEAGYTSDGETLPFIVAIKKFAAISEEDMGKIVSSNSLDTLRTYSDGEVKKIFIPMYIPKGDGTYELVVSEDQLKLLPEFYNEYYINKDKQGIKKDFNEYLNWVKNSEFNKQEYLTVSKEQRSELLKGFVDKNIPTNFFDSSLPVIGYNTKNFDIVKMLELGLISKSSVLNNNSFDTLNDLIKKLPSNFDESVKKSLDSFRKILQFDTTNAHSADDDADFSLFVTIKHLMSITNINKLQSDVIDDIANIKKQLFGDVNATVFREEADRLDSILKPYAISNLSKSVSDQKFIDGYRKVILNPNRVNANAELIKQVISVYNQILNNNDWQVGFRYRNEYLEQEAGNSMQYYRHMEIPENRKNLSDMLNYFIYKLNQRRDENGIYYSKNIYNTFETKDKKFTTNEDYISKILSVAFKEDNDSNLSNKQLFEKVFMLTPEEIFDKLSNIKYKDKDLGVIEFSNEDYTKFKNDIQINRINFEDVANKFVDTNGLKILNTELEKSSLSAQFYMALKPLLQFSSKDLPDEISNFIENELFTMGGRSFTNQDGTLKLYDENTRSRWYQKDAYTDQAKALMLKSFVPKSIDYRAMYENAEFLTSANRLNVLQLDGSTIEEFAKSDSLYVSENRLEALFDGLKDLKQIKSLLGLSPTDDIYIPLLRHPSDKGDTIHLYKLKVVKDATINTAIVGNALLSLHSGDNDGDKFFLFQPTADFQSFGKKTVDSLRAGFKIFDDALENIIKSNAGYSKDDNFNIAEIMKISDQFKVDVKKDYKAIKDSKATYAELRKLAEQKMSKILGTEDPDKIKKYLDYAWIKETDNRDLGVEGLVYTTRNYNLANVEWNVQGNSRLDYAKRIFWYDLQQADQVTGLAKTFAERAQGPAKELFNYARINLTEDSMMLLAKNKDAFISEFKNILNADNSYIENNGTRNYLNSLLSDASKETGDQAALKLLEFLRNYDDVIRSSKLFNSNILSAVDEMNKFGNPLMEKRQRETLEATQAYAKAHGINSLDVLSDQIKMLDEIIGLENSWMSNGSNYTRALRDEIDQRVNQIEQGRVIYKNKLDVNNKKSYEESDSYQNFLNRKVMFVIKEPKSFVGSEEASFLTQPGQNIVNTRITSLVFEKGLSPYKEIRSLKANSVIETGPNGLQISDNVKLPPNKKFYLVASSWATKNNDNYANGKEYISLVETTGLNSNSKVVIAGTNVMKGLVQKLSTKNQINLMGEKISNLINTEEISFVTKSSSDLIKKNFLGNGLNNKTKFTYYDEDGNITSENNAAYAVADLKITITEDKNYWQNGLKSGIVFDDLSITNNLRSVESYPFMNLGQLNIKFNSNGEPEGIYDTTEVAKLHELKSSFGRPDRSEVNGNYAYKILMLKEILFSPFVKGSIEEKVSMFKTFANNTQFSGTDGTSKLASLFKTYINTPELKEQWNNYARSDKMRERLFSTELNSLFNEPDLIRVQVSEDTPITPQTTKRTYPIDLITSGQAEGFFGKSKLTTDAHRLHQRKSDGLIYQDNTDGFLTVRNLVNYLLKDTGNYVPSSLVDSMMRKNIMNTANIVPGDMSNGFRPIAVRDAMIIDEENQQIFSGAIGKKTDPKVANAGIQLSGGKETPMNLKTIRETQSDSNIARMQDAELISKLFTDDEKDTNNNIIPNSSRKYKTLFKPTTGETDLMPVKLRDQYFKKYVYGSLANTKDIAERMYLFGKGADEIYAPLSVKKVFTSDNGFVIKMIPSNIKTSMANWKTDLINQLSSYEYHDTVDGYETTLRNNLESMAKNYIGKNKLVYNDLPDSSIFKHIDNKRQEELNKTKSLKDQGVTLKNYTNPFEIKKEASDYQAQGLFGKGTLFGKVNDALNNLPNNQDGHKLYNKQEYLQPKTFEEVAYAEERRLVDGDADALKVEIKTDLLESTGTKITNEEDMAYAEIALQARKEPANIEMMLSQDIMKLYETVSRFGMQDQFDKFAYKYAMITAIEELDRRLNSKQLSSQEKIDLELTKSNILNSVGEKDLDGLKKSTEKFDKTFQDIVQPFKETMAKLYNYQNVYGKLTNEPIDNAYWLITPVIKKSTAKDLKTMIEHIVFNPKSIKDMNHVTAYNGYHFFPSIYKTIQSLSKHMAAYNLGQRLISKGFLNNQIIYNIAEKKFKELVNSESGKARAAEIKATDSEIEHFNILEEIINNQLSGFGTVKLNEITINKNKMTMIDAYMKMRENLLGMIQKYGMSYEEARQKYETEIDETKRLEAGAIMTMHNFANDIAAIINSKLVGESGMSAVYAEMKSYADSHDMVLVDQYGRILQPDASKFHPLSPLSHEYVERLLRYNLNSLGGFEKNVVTDAFSGGVYLMSKSAAEHLDKFFYTTSTPKGLKKALIKVQSIATRLLMSSPFKLADRLIKYTLTDVGILSTANPTTILKMGEAKNELSALIQSKGAVTTDRLKAFLYATGINPEKIDFNAIFNSNEDYQTSGNLFKGYIKVTDQINKAFTYQTLLTRYAYFLATSEALEKGKATYGSAYYMKDLINKKGEVIDPTTNEVKLTAAQNKAAFLMAQQLGAPGDFPEISKVLNGYMMFTTFPMALLRWGRGEVQSLATAAKNLFVEGEQAGAVKHLTVTGGGLLGSYLLGQLLIMLISQLYGVDEETEEEWKEDQAMPEIFATLIQGTPVMDRFNSMNPIDLIGDLTYKPFVKAAQEQAQDETREYTGTDITRGNGLYKWLTSNVWGKLNPALTDPIEAMAGADSIGDSIYLNDNNGFENMTRKLSGYLVGAAGSNALAKYVSQLPYEDKTFPQAIADGISVAVNAELGNTKEYKANVKNYYDAMEIINTYLYAGYVPENSINYTSSFNQGNYNSFKAELQEAMNNRVKQTQIYAIIQNALTNGISISEIKSAFTNISIYGKLNKIQDYNSFINNLSEEQEDQIKQALAYERYTFPWLETITDEIVDEYYKQRYPEPDRLKIYNDYNNYVMYNNNSNKYNNYYYQPTYSNKIDPFKTYRSSWYNWHQKEEVNN